MKYGKRAYLWTSPPPSTNPPPTSKPTTPPIAPLKGRGLEEKVKEVMEEEQATPYTYPLARLKDIMEKILKMPNTPLDIRLSLYDNFRRQYENLFAESRQDRDPPSPPVVHEEEILPPSPKKKKTPQKKKNPPAEEEKRRRSRRIADREKRPPLAWTQVKFYRP